MFPPLDIFRTESDGELVWLATADTLTQARSQVGTLMLRNPADYVIYSQETGRKSIVRRGDSKKALPACPTHDAFMVQHCFQSWELSLGHGTLEGFRCPNLSCPIVYIETLEGFHTLTDHGKLTRLPPTKSAG